MMNYAKTSIVEYNKTQSNFTIVEIEGEAKHRVVSLPKLAKTPLALDFAPFQHILPICAIVMVIQLEI
jgi:hypothetical protein